MSAPCSTNLNSQTVFFFEAHHTLTGSAESKHKYFVADTFCKTSLSDKKAQVKLQHFHGFPLDKIAETTTHKPTRSVSKMKHVQIFSDKIRHCRSLSVTTSHRPVATIFHVGGGAGGRGTNQSMLE